MFVILTFLEKSLTKTTDILTMFSYSPKEINTFELDAIHIVSRRWRHYTKFPCKYFQCEAQYK